jgi:hypothetical protein
VLKRTTFAVAWLAVALTMGASGAETATVQTAQTAQTVQTTGAAAEAAPHDLYVYGHSWTSGYGLRDKSKSYPRLVAAARDETLHNRGVNGPLVHQLADYVVGPGDGTWRAGTTGDVVIQAVSNTARDLGVNRLAMETTRNALRAMVATVSASRRIEDGSSSHRYSGTWHRRALSRASGGSVHATRSRDASVRFRAVGGEYVVLRGTSGAGVTVRVSDVTTGVTVARIRTGRRLHPKYDADGIPLVRRIPPRLAGHTIRLTKESGAGGFVFDARLPQPRHPNTVVLLEEPYLLDYSLSTAHPYGSDHVMDVFNQVTARVAAGFPNAVAVDPNSNGWDKRTMLLPHETHPNAVGSRLVADLIVRALGGAAAG